VTQDSLSRLIGNKKDPNCPYLVVSFDRNGGRIMMTEFVLSLYLMKAMKAEKPTTIREYIDAAPVAGQPHLRAIARPP
jgi:hypothetical protein